MSQTITAVYTNGTLKLHQPLELPNNTTVSLRVTALALDEQVPLIDGIPVAQDPELYARAAEIGPHAYTQHAWEILPLRYAPNQDGRSQRIRLDTFEDPLAHIHEFAVDMGIEDLAENFDAYRHGVIEQDE
jgi:predicted DNA-binding antitoxin AbrB/MazE fold protein